MARHKLTGTISSAARWLLTAGVVGAVAGLASVLLTFACTGAEILHDRVPALSFALPVMGVLAVLIYRAFGLPYDVGTMGALDSSRTDRPVPWGIAPAILLGTSLTVLGGGSVGKEAGAMQMGSGVASALRGLLGKEGSREGASRVLLMCGMSAAFSALMLTPVAAVAFVLEAVRPSRRTLLDLRVPCIVIASFAGWGVASVLGAGRIWKPEGDVPGVLGLSPQTLAVAAACALAGLAFVVLLKLVRTAWLRLFRNDFARVAVGAVVLAAVLVLVPGARVASGTGASLIAAALGGSGVDVWDIVWKFALTVLTIGFGLKGGEIMPVMCVGACLGCVLGTGLGEPSGFASAVGLVAMFSACTRCPVAACLLGIEAFGLAGGLAWGVAALIGVPAAALSSLYDSSLWRFGSPMSRHRTNDPV